MTDQTIAATPAERTLRGLAATALMLSQQHLALAERYAATHDALERVADGVYADEQDRHYNHKEGPV